MRNDYVSKLEDYDGYLTIKDLYKGMTGRSLLTKLTGRDREAILDNYDRLDSKEKYEIRFQRAGYIDSAIRGQVAFSISSAAALFLAGYLLPENDPGYPYGNLFTGLVLSLAGGVTGMAMYDLLDFKEDTQRSIENNKLLNNRLLRL